jgi:hypothetical protein
MKNHKRYFQVFSWEMSCLENDHFRKQFTWEMCTSLGKRLLGKCPLAHFPVVNKPKSVICPSAK